MAGVASQCGLDFGAAFALFEKDYAASMARRQRACLRQLASLNKDG